MNFSQFADLASDACVSVPDAEENYYPAAGVLNQLEVPRETLRTRLWAGEKRFVFDEEEGQVEVVNSP